VNTLLDHGLARRLSEPEPTAEALHERPELVDETRRPPFLLIAAARKFDSEDYIARCDGLTK
jgi:hypothetical protein